jgi:hypothetical protein
METALCEEGGAMTELVKRLLDAGIASIEAVPTTKGELVVVPTLEGRVANIRRAHRECIEALTRSLASAIVAGRELIALKADLKAGKSGVLWQDYVSVECGLTPRTAQNYMHLAKHEAALAPFLSGKTQGSAFSQAQALKFLGDERKKRKRRKPAT